MSGATEGASLRYVAVAKRYGPLTALHPVDLSIASGEFFAMIGPSGSGKTTLLGITAGFVTPSQGQVLVNGRDIVGEPPHRRAVGMVFQNYSLFPHMTVAENVGFPLRMRRVKRAEIAARVQAALAMVRMGQMGDRLPAQLSGGQQQRVALARAAVYRPALLLMDEPLGALDKNLREEMQDEIRRLQRELGATVVYVTHDQQEAATLADRVAILRNGRVEQVGPPHEIYEMPANRFVASFLGEANLLPLEATQGERARTAGGLELAVATSDAASGPEPTLCLRPENVRLGEAAAGLGNAWTATVLEAVHIAGSIRYRLQLPGGTVLLARAPARIGDPVWQAGATVVAGWRPADAVILLA
ncbi:MAG: ABC transporter ATP-binding protein [Rhodospirillales bacterium]|nr:ABC transporter ATP-binding protein [Rhodospirillales bacterium]